MKRTTVLSTLVVTLVVVAGAVPILAATAPMTLDGVGEYENPTEVIPNGTALSDHDLMTIYGGSLMDVIDFIGRVVREIKDLLDPPVIRL